MNDGSGRAVTWRIAFSIVTSMIWLIFVVAWIGFGWAGFEIGENIAVICISSVIYLGLNGLVWAIWPGGKSESSGEAE